MTGIGRIGGALAVAGALLLGGSARALTPAEKCESSQLKATSKYGFCRLKASAKALKTGTAPDFSQCDATFSAKFGQADTKGMGQCPASADQATLQAFITQCSNAVASALAGGPLSQVQPPPLKTGQTTAYGTGTDGDLQKGAGRSFTDNGDGTITDNTTGLMWEKKDDSGGIHDKDNTYTWGMTSSPYTMNGTAATMFLAALNTPSCFAGHCDWRIPNVSELQSIVDYQTVSPAASSVFSTGCVAGCTVTSCSCTQSSLYWTSTTYQNLPASAWFVYFGVGSAGGNAKSNSYSVRAVRGG